MDLHILSLPYHCSVSQSCPALCDSIDCNMPGLPVHHHLLLKLTSIEFVMPSNHFILCHPLLFLPSIYHLIRVFSSEWNLYIRWPTCWSFSFSISPSNENSGFDLLAVQGTLKSLLQHQLDSINSSMLSLCYGQTLTSHISQSDVSAF